MEDLAGAHIDGVSNTIRRKRSQTSRRPPPDSLPAPANREFSPSSSTPTSDDASKVSSEENPGYYNISSRKESNFRQCAKRVASAGESEFESTPKDFTEQEQFSSDRDPANWKGSSNSTDSGENQHVGPSHMSSDILENENKVKKVKLKVCGVLHTIQTNFSSNGTLRDGSSSKSSLSPNISQEQQSLHFQGNSIGNHSFPNKKSGLRGIPWKDFSVGFNLKKDSSMGKMKHLEKSEAVRKSKRVPKKRVMHGAFDDDEDDEIRYLEKLKTIKFSGGYKGDEERCGKKQRSVSKNLKDIGSPSGKVKKLKSDEASEDTDYEEDPTSDGELGGSEKKKPKKESIQLLMEGKRELSLTTRQRALQSGKEASAVAIEFPNGLPTAPSRKQKEKLSEVEQQLKKAEAAQRRRMQVEKAARESEAEAIRKILGQDSSRKKREDKIKKRREELEREKTANALMLASNTVRWIMGPAGTTVTFPKDMGLPEIFDAKPFSYPPPREKCAGPSCPNPYRYRDSKSKLPLCSLECYKAVQGKVQAEATY